MKGELGAILAACLLLTGCASLLEREYTTVEEHSSKYWEGEAANSLRAESYQDLVNDFLLLVGSHTEDALLRLYGYEDDAVVADALEQAAAEVQLQTPMGAYAVEYITAEKQRQRPLGLSGDQVCRLSSLRPTQYQSTKSCKSARVNGFCLRV